MAEGCEPSLGLPQPRSRAEYTCLYLLFALFGCGSGWLVVGALFLELAVYEETLGLLAANRCSLGYQVGALLVPCFTAVRHLLKRWGVGVSYQALIVAIACVNLANLGIMACGLQSLEALMAASFLGGGCGYLSGVVQQAYLVLNCEDVWIAAFATGDAASGVIAALLAAVQRPETGPEGRRFGPEALYAMMMPLVLMALAIFWVIDRKALGFLPSKAAQQLPSKPALLSGKAPEQIPPLAAPEEDVDVERPAKRPAVEEVEMADRSAAGEAEVKEATQSSGGQETKAEQQEFQPLKDAAQPVVGGTLVRLLPAGAVSRPGITTVLLAVGFWMSFTCWGIGDSVIPYACEKTSKGDEGERCLFHSSLGTVGAVLAGSHLAGIASEPTMSLLVGPTLIYSATFALLCLAALWGGRWAKPFLGPPGNALATGEEVLEINEGGYVVVLVFLMRSLQPYVQVVRQRLIQRLYEPEDHEDMNLFLYYFTVAANLLGVIVVTLLLA